LALAWLCLAHPQSALLLLLLLRLLRLWLARP
jgi:hypothetical protein